MPCAVLRGRATRGRPDAQILRTRPRAVDPGCVTRATERSDSPCAPSSSSAIATCASTEIEPPPPPGPGEVQIRVRAVGAQLSRRLGLSRHGLRQAQDAAGRRRRGVRRDRGGRRGRDAASRSATRSPCTAPRPAAIARPAARAATISARTSPASWASISTASPASWSTGRSGSSIKVPDGVSFEDAACAPIGFGTVQHMLFDNAKLEPGEIDPRPCRRLRHRHGGDQDGQGHRLHGLHHGRRRREGREGARRSAPTTSSTTAPSASRARSAS